MSDTLSLVVLTSGALAAGYAVIALFFLRFWRRSRDRLFLFFAAAFVVLVFQRVALTLAYVHGMESTWIYVVRLGAFLLILAGIADKNRPG